MPNSLKIFLIISILIFIIHVIQNVKTNHLSVRNCIIWLIMSLAIIISVFQIDTLAKIADFLGIKTVANLFFFLGFIFLIFVSFDVLRTQSLQNKKIIKLTQELALLRKEIENDKKHQ